MIDAEELNWLGNTPLIAAYRSGANGRSAAQIGLSRALARAAQNPAPLINRTMPPMTAAKSNVAKVNDQSAEVDRPAIIQSANEAEKKRWATVLANGASQGREKMAAHLLNWPHRFSASQIIAALQATGSGAAKIGKTVNWEVARAEMLQRTGRA